VTVLDLGTPGHVRVPRYIRGRTGVIEQYCGSFLNPEELSIGSSDGRIVPLYRVRFDQRHVWPDYAGEPGDCLHIEIHEHWLAAASAASAHLAPPLP
jgi:nitrile hydratase